MNEARFRISLAAFLTAVIVFAPLAAQAHPVSFKNGTGVMFFATPEWQDLEVFHSFEADEAAGLRVLRLDGEKNGQSLDRRVFGAQYNKLLKRWWWEDAQANIYLGGGLGVADGKGVSGDPVGIGLLQADYETQRVYSALKLDLFESEEFTHLNWTADLGASPYAANYDELAPWFILRFSQMTGMDDKPDVIPTFRLIYKQIFLEGGVSLDGDPRLTFMIHF